MYDNLKRAEILKKEKPGDKGQNGALAEGIRKILKELEKVE